MWREVDTGAIRARAEAAQRGAPGPWEMLPGSALVVQGPNAYEGEAVAECEKPDALKVDSVAEEVRLMRERWQPVAAHIAGMDPTTTLRILDALDEARAEVALNKSVEGSVAAISQANEKMSAEVARLQALLARLLSHTAPHAREGETCVDTAIRMLDVANFDASAAARECHRLRALLEPVQAAARAVLGNAEAGDPEGVNADLCAVLRDRSLATIADEEKPDAR